MDVQEVLNRFDRVRALGERSWSARCSAHEDRTPSLSITVVENKILLKCHAGCSTEDVCHAVGLELRDLFLDDTKPSPQRSVIKQVYSYTDESGNELYQVCRMEPKSFRQRRMIDGEWVWGLCGGTYYRGISGWYRTNRNGTTETKQFPSCRMVLFQLQLIVKSEGRVVIVSESEKNSLKLTSLGFVATNSPGGAGKWNSSYGRYLAGRHVVVLPDNDQPGIDHAQTICGNCILHGVRSLRMVVLPGLPKGGDVVDWLEMGHKKEDLVSQIRKARSYQCP